MFSHVAEETTRLAHGFLGALFALAILMANTNFVPIAVLCVALYVAFVLNTAILHRLFCIAVLNETGKVFMAGLMFLVEISIFFGVLVFFVLDVQNTFEGPYEAPLKFGLGVYVTFIVLMNLSHINEIYDLQRKAKKTDTQGARA